MKLPTELRWMIYSFALKYSKAIHRSNFNRSRLDPTVAALLQTSKQVEAEAAPLFYRLNTFRFCKMPLLPSYDDIQTVCRAIDIPSRYVSQLRTVYLSQNVCCFRKVLAFGIGDTIAWLSVSAPLIKSLSVHIWWDDDPRYRLEDKHWHYIARTLVQPVRENSNLSSFRLIAGNLNDYDQVVIVPWISPWAVNPTLRLSTIIDFGRYVKQYQNIVRESYVFSPSPRWRGALVFSLIIEAQEGQEDSNPVRKWIRAPNKPIAEIEVHYL